VELVCQELPLPPKNPGREDPPVVLFSMKFRVFLAQKRALEKECFLFRLPPNHCCCFLFGSLLSFWSFPLPSHLTCKYPIGVRLPFHPRLLYRFSHDPAFFFPPFSRL